MVAWLEGILEHQCGGRLGGEEYGLDAARKAEADVPYILA